MVWFNRLFLGVAKSLNHSKYYKDIKKYFDDILNDTENPTKKYIDLLMIFFIISSVVILVYGVENQVPKWLDFYDLYFVSVVFLVEYLLRLWVHTDLFRLVLDEEKRAHFLETDFSLSRPMKRALERTFEYMLTPAMIIDFVAIMPILREFRILRVVIIFRLFKLLRYTRSINQFIEVLKYKQFELTLLLILLAFVMTAAGIAIYLFEVHVNPNIDSFFDALYWALITIATVGYGDISPVTPEGRVVSMIIIVVGITMISFATSVIVSAFSEKLIELKENQILGQLNRGEEFLLVCGYGQMTKMFMRREETTRHNYIIIEKNKERYLQAVKDGYNAILEDASRHDALMKFKIQHSKTTILCLINSDIENIYISLNAKSISPEIRVIARASNASMIQKFKRAGVNDVLLPDMIASMMMRVAISRPHLYKAAHAIFAGKDIAVLDEIRLFHGDGLVGKRVGEIDFRKMRLLLMAVERGGEGEFLFNPAADEVLRENDVLILMGYRIGLEHFKDHYDESI